MKHRTAHFLTRRISKATSPTLSSGLTKGKSPDELDKIDKELRDKKLKNADWKDFDKKWYETMDTNEYNNGFWGFGMGVSGVFDVAGKVFKYNQYAIRENL